MTDVRPVELIFGRDWRDSVRFLSELRPRRPANPPVDLIEINDVVDLVVDGVNLTAAISEESVFGFVLQLMEALWRMASGQMTKTIVEFHCEPWELCLHACGADVLVSVYSVGRRQRVLAHDVAVEPIALLAAVTASAGELLSDLLAISDGFATDPFVRRMSALLGKLRRVHDVRFPDLVGVEAATLASSTASRSGLSMTYSLDATYSGFAAYAGEQAFDQHALLLPGQLCAEFDGREVVLTDRYPLLAVRELVDRSRDLLSLLESSSEVFDCADGLFQLRLDVAARRDVWAVTLGKAGRGGTPLQIDVSPHELLDTLLTAAELVANDMLEANEHISLNQRFVELRNDLTELRGWLCDISDPNHYLEQPEAYLTQNGDLRNVVSEPASADFPWPLASVRALYPTVKWRHRAQMELGAIQTDQERLLVPSESTVLCLDRDSGEVCWEQGPFAGSPLTSFASSGTRVAIADEIGRTLVVDAQTGRPLSGKPPVVGNVLLHASHYVEPELLVVADGHGTLSGLHSETGARRWVFEAGHGGLVGAANDGPLFTALTAPGFLHAVNPLNGELLWRVRLGGLADAGPYFHQGRIYTVSHGPRTRYFTVHAFLPFTGRVAWQMRLDGWLVGAPTFIDDWMVLPVERHGRVALVGVNVEAFHPAPQWRVEILSAGVDHPTAVVKVDIKGVAHGVVRSDTAEVTCFRLADGVVRWRAAPDGPTELLFRNLELSVVRDALVEVADHIRLRSLHDGSVIHEIGDVLVSPEFYEVSGDLRVLVGDRGATRDELDALTMFSLGHYLAVVA